MNHYKVSPHRLHLPEMLSGIDTIISAKDDDTFWKKINITKNFNSKITSDFEANCLKTESIFKVSIVENPVCLFSTFK